MSRTHHHGKYRITGERRAKPDTRRLTKALQAWVEAQREREAMSEDHTRRRPTSGRTTSKRRAS